MKVFISWSGERSRRTARVLRDWLPQVLQAVEPWMSEEDIEKGSRSTTEIKLALQDASFGIVCVTRENVSAPWLNFEAGALSKEVLDARVYVAPFLLDMGPQDIRGPLTDFQVTRNTEADVRRMMATLNGQLATPLGGGVFDRAFSMWWPELEKQLAVVLAETEDGPVKPPPSTEELLAEILTNVRHSRRVETAEQIHVTAQPQQSLSREAQMQRRIRTARSKIRELVLSVMPTAAVEFSPSGTSFDIMVPGLMSDLSENVIEQLREICAKYGVAGDLTFPDDPKAPRIGFPPF
ncbi:toll/interleukin-1 receptor domain-containing protein [Oryzobacter terrae]|uniref:toll/interleukin-1 receptor domain-containing protein n=1 Tax=Oryzobacter terrae TaxID=1620385 RepID=UPI00366F7BA7